MCRDQALNAAATAHVRRWRTARQHQLQRAKQAVSHHKVVHIARVVKCDEDLVGKATALAENPADLAGDTFAQRDQCSLPFASMTGESMRSRSCLACQHVI